MTVAGTMNYAYDIMLQTPDDKLLLTRVYDQHFAAVVAHRIKSIAQIRSEDAVSEKPKHQPIKPKAKRTDMQLPHGIILSQNTRAIQIAWQSS